MQCGKRLRSTGLSNRKITNASRCLPIVRLQSSVTHSFKPATHLVFKFWQVCVSGTHCVNGFVKIDAINYRRALFIRYVSMTRDPRIAVEASTCELVCTRLTCWDAQQLHDLYTQCLQYSGDLEDVWCVYTLCRCMWHIVCVCVRVCVIV